MTDEGFELGIKIVVIISILIIVCEIILAFRVLKSRTVSTSILDDVSKDVSSSELLKEQDVNNINLDEIYVEE